MAKRIIIAGGGTGGHIFPAVAIANALKRYDAKTEILFVGALGKMEMEKVPQAGYKIQGIPIAGFNRSSLIKNIGLPWMLLKSFLRVRQIVNAFQPDAVIGVGGYSSFPVLRYAQTKNIPTFIHESNSFAGKSNKLLGKKATTIFVATDGMEAFFPKGKLVVTGNPIRPAIANTAAIPKDAALAHFGLTNSKPTVLAIGGSLGARSINEAIEKGLDALKQNNIQLIWQTGKSDATRWKEKTQGREGAWVSDFITEMEQAYAAADIVVSRAGAMAVSELCMVQKPVVFVPYPFAAEDHQTANATNLVKREAALMVKDSEAKEKIVPLLIELAHNMGLRNSLKIAIGKYAVQKADEHIVKEILDRI
ncbi:MAG TPA: undecaprenyldiphospho-muramoylpentapeptide beta-N-acetylglucosaminyltransferase [Chitinophagaceae bacterium]|nr:undecaprenyldiphospho-muramoylpentapeptide beta-N-acetylglucosaminyltransferase [Chitinophagaceae bacterium]